MAGYTPGPWRITGSFNGREIASAGDIVAFARSSIYRIGIEEARSNARLIAAAPELLEALIALTNEAHKNMAGGAGHLIDDALAAIQKAEGR